jgi:hypothetical protein
MSNELLKSVHAFQARDIDTSLASAAAFCKGYFGVDAFHDLSPSLVPEYLDKDWANFLLACLKTSASEIAIGSFLQQMWVHFPSQSILDIVSCFNYRDFPHLQYHPVEEAFDSIGGDDMLEIFSAGCRTGFIQFPEGEIPYGIMPTLDEEFFSRLEAEQLEDYIIIRLRSAIQKGKDQRPVNYLELLVADHCELLTKIIVRDFFMPARAQSFVSKRLVYSHAHYPLWTDARANAILNLCQVSTQGALQAILYDYTAGAVAVEDPRAWLEQLAAAIATGNPSKLPQIQ